MVGRGAPANAPVLARGSPVGPGTSCGLGGLPPHPPYGHLLPAGEKGMVEVATEGNTGAVVIAETDR